MAGYVLGLSAYYHDAAAALVRNGHVIAAAQEERFSRRKHDPRFPRQAINYCLAEAFIKPSELDAVVFYDSPLLTLDRFIKNAVTVAPAGRNQFAAGCRSILGAKSRLRDDLESTLGIVPALLGTTHHMAHAASAFYPSPFEEAAILTIDGVGEWATCALGLGRGTHIEFTDEIHYPHSIGLLYSTFTYYCGFKVNSGEYKLMGLAPFGEPRYAGIIRDKLIDVREDGSFRLDTSYFGFLDSPLMTNAAFERLFGGRARTPDTAMTQRDADLAASVQRVVEDLVLKLVAHVVSSTGLKKLVMAGGVALNCVVNGRVLREAGLDGFFIQPAAGDAGGALGAALLVSLVRYGAPRVSLDGTDVLKGSLLGPGFASHEVEAVLDRQDAPHHYVPDPTERASLIAQALADGQVVALFSGRMEFGPRALGARSILGDPRRADMQRTMNLKVKFRESFRPFAPSVLAERASEYFELAADSPYMLLVAPVKHGRRLPTSTSPCEDGGPDLFERVSQKRSDIPAVTHVDYSARVHTAGIHSHAELRRILHAFFSKTGCPVLVNTSFNVRGEPIVCTPHDAYRCFMRTGIDVLVLEDRLLWKHEQPAYQLSDDDDTSFDVSHDPAIGQLALDVFDRDILPLAERRRLANQPAYFPVSADAQASTYFESPSIRTTHHGDFDFPGGGEPAGLIDAAARYWTTRAEMDLVALAPALHELGAALGDEVQQNDGSVSILCYTMF